MQLKDLFEKWQLSGLKINTGFLTAEWSPKDADKDAAWELYVELLTRITTQALPSDAGTEEAALASIHSLFATTREVLKRQGRECVQCAKVAVIILNQIVRPFTASWHPRFQGPALSAKQRACFRQELCQLQSQLIAYGHLLADIAGIEDITTLEIPDADPHQRTRC